MKVACTVLEGESGGNPTDLLGEFRNPKDDTESKISGFSKKKKNITENDCRDKKAGWE